MNEKFLTFVQSRPFVPSLAGLAAVAFSQPKLVENPDNIPLAAKKKQKTHLFVFVFPQHKEIDTK